MARTREKSMIETCILRSKFIIASIAFKFQLRQAGFFHNRMSSNLPSSGYLKELSEETDQQIHDHETSIARYLKPIFQTAGLEPKETFLFNYDDLRAGYVELTKSDPFIVTHILLLSEITDMSFGTIYDAGTIHPKEEIKHLLVDLKSQVNEDSITIQYAMKRSIL